MKRRTQSRATQYAVLVAKNQAYHKLLEKQNMKRPTALWDKLSKTIKP